MTWKLFLLFISKLNIQLPDVLFHHLSRLIECLVRAHEAGTLRVRARVDTPQKKSASSVFKTSSVTQNLKYNHFRVEHIFNKKKNHDYLLRMN